MERDFLGLSSSEPSGVVNKEEIGSEACRDSAQQPTVHGPHLNPSCPKQEPTPGNTIISDHVVLKQPTARPCSSLSSPVVSHPAPELGSGPANVEKGNTEGVTAPGNVDSPKTVGARRSISATTMISAAIPQAPKASLARFLEKRKERVRNAAPYGVVKNSSPERATPASSPAKLSSGPAVDEDTR